MQDQAMLAMYVGIGVIALIILVVVIVVPRQLRKGRARAKAAKVDLTAEIESRTGLKWNGQLFEGDYKGYHLKLQKALGSNENKIQETTRDMLWGTNSGNSMYGQSTFFPVVRCWLTKEGANFPDVTLFQTSNYFLNTDEFWNNRLNGRVPDEKKLDLDADPLHKKAKLYGDESGAQKMLTSSELQQAMKDWIYPDLRAEGNEIRLELNNSNIIPKWGHKKTSGTEWLVQAADICVATAKALEN